MESSSRAQLRPGQQSESDPQLGLFGAGAPDPLPDEVPGATAVPSPDPLPVPANTATHAPVRSIGAPAPVPSPSRGRRTGGMPAWTTAARGSYEGRTRTKTESEPEPGSGSEAAPGAEVEIAVAPARRVWRVGTLVSEVRSHLEEAYADVWVEGEVSNLRLAGSGHVYFTLKDGEAQLPAVLFRRQAQLLRFRLEDGLQVLLRGRVSVYEQRGQMQLIGEYVEPVGAGSLQVAFEQLKARLEAEGLFAAARKRALPAFPRCIGIVTSPAGAVIRDFLHVAGRRHGALEVLIYPALVQGESAAAEVAAGIGWFNRGKIGGRVDIIVIARGGGSPEDLAPFNSELMARAIAASDLPVVSAVGHETDFTIADFVADLRAPTPSAAAELLTEAQFTVEAQVQALRERLERAGRYRMMIARQRLTAVSIETALARLLAGLNRREQRVDELRFRLDASIGGRLRRSSDRLQQGNARLARQDIAHRLQAGRERLVTLESRLQRAGAGTVAGGRGRQEILARQLATLSPLAVLARGYALVFDGEGALLKDAAAAAVGDPLRVRLGRGNLSATVTDTSTKEAE